MTEEVKIYPNPFNNFAVVNYSLPYSSRVSLIIYDINGRVVRRILDNEYKPGGSHIYKLSASSLSSGTYILRIISKNINYSQKLILVK